MACLGHREGAGNLGTNCTAQEGLVVVFGSQIQNSRAEQSVLDAIFNLQRRVCKQKLFEARKGSPGVHGSTEL